MRIRGCIVISLLASFSLSAAGQNLQTQIEECEACHGAGGVSSQDDIPILAGMDSAQLREMLDQFYFYERHCTTTTYRHGDRPKTPMNMCNVANTLSDADKLALAEYFANQPR